MKFFMKFIFIMIIINNMIFIMNILMIIFIRVFMTFTPSKSFIEIPEQKLTEAPERTGFTLVEWGGSVIY